MKNLIKDPNGQQSMMRVMTIFVIGLTMVVWALMTWKTGGMIDIPENILWLNAAIISGKAGQRFFETDQKRE